MRSVNLLSNKVASFLIPTNITVLFSFLNSRSAVIRGRVVNPSKRGLVGVRVTRVESSSSSSSSNAGEGYTMTRSDGWFDLMVNGGGAVTLRFGKRPFPPRERSLFVPWNEVSRLHVVKKWKRRS